MILQYLGQQGVGGSLLSSLGNIWAPAAAADSAALTAQFADALILLGPELVDPVLDLLAKLRIVLVIALRQRRVEFAGLDVDDHPRHAAADQIPEPGMFSCG